jgi:hypothetical protein
MENCTLCQSTNIKEIPDTRNVYHWECDVCGEIIITRTAFAGISKYSSKFWMLSSYCRKIEKSGNPPVMISTSNISEILDTIMKPKSIIDAQNKFVKLLGNQTDLLGSWIQYDENLHLDIVVQKKELEFLLYTLFSIEYLEIDATQRAFELLKNGKGFNHSELSKLRLTRKGLEKYNELQKQRFDSNQVFVAMWYDNETEKLRKSLKAGITAAGYDPIIVDEKYFTGNIMEFVISRIRESKFVVADFTSTPEEKIKIEKNNDEPKNNLVRRGTRGGVYYEAGFAKGLGLQVIHTCKNNNKSKNRLHFDIKQENTIFWKDGETEDVSVRQLKDRPIDNYSPQNLAERLYDRIIYIFGIGLT